MLCVICGTPRVLLPFIAHKQWFQDIRVALRHGFSNTNLVDSYLQSNRTHRLGYDERCCHKPPQLSHLFYPCFPQQLRLHSSSALFYGILLFQQLPTPPGLDGTQIFKIELSYCFYVVKTWNCCSIDLRCRDVQSWCGVGCHWEFQASAAAELARNSITCIPTMWTSNLRR